MKNINNIKEIGNFVRQTRKEQGLNQTEAAGLLGVGTRFFSELENGKETLEIGKVLQVLNGLKIKIKFEHEDQ